MSPRRALSLPRAVRRAILAHARRARPLECCGLLVGRGPHVSFIVPMRNTARSRTRYRIDPGHHIALRKIVRTLVPRADIVGVYHSHPSGPPRPSRTDVAEAFYPDWAYVIAGLRGRRARLAAWALDRGAARRVVIRVRPRKHGPPGWVGRI